MAKKSALISGKKPVNTAQKAVAKKYTGQVNPGHISNKLKRSEMYGKYLQQKRIEKRQRRLTREKEAEALGEDITVRKKQTPRTIDNTREAEPTTVAAVDPEVEADEAGDEFAPFLTGEKPPKLLITTRPRPSQKLFYFIADLQKLIPNLHFYPRQSYSIKEICAFAGNRDFTHLLVLSEKAKACNGLTVSLLPHGPTAFFKLTNVVVGSDIPQHGCGTSHIPELNLHGFGTRLGHRVGRLFGSLFPPPQLHGRQVVTFHNQRDFIFVRQHRYIFAETKTKQSKTEQQQQQQPPAKARLQELGPRFTLKLRWIQAGTFDTQTGEYEYFHKRKEMDTSRRKFHL